MNDRIKLAEAMGWAHQETYHCWHRPDGSLLPREFDPFTDANDDYAVLEWMRETYIDIGGTSVKWEMFCRALLHIRSVPPTETQWTSYRVGDYAKAALKVIDDE